MNVGDVTGGADADGVPAELGEPSQAFAVVGSVDAIGVAPPGPLTQSRRHNSLRQVVDPAPTGALSDHNLAEIEQPLHRNLRVRPIPPVSTLLGAAQVACGEGPFGPQPVGDGSERRARNSVPALPLARIVTTAKSEPRPLDHRQDARRVGPILESRITVPVRGLYRVAAHRAEPRVGDELMRSCQYGDRVELHRTEMPQHLDD